MELVNKLFKLFGFKFVGNRRSLEVHNLYNLKTQCSVDKMATKNKDFFFKLASAQKNGYDNCRWCIGNSNR